MKLNKYPKPKKCPSCGKRMVHVCYSNKCRNIDMNQEKKPFIPKYGEQIK